MVKTGLSKSRILSGLQCQKRLYLETYSKELADESGSEYAFAVGNQIGEIARTLHPGGKLIEHDNALGLALEETQVLLSDSDDVTIFEATIQHEGVLIRADILIKTNESVEFIEVKAATSVKPQYLPDCAVQAWVLAQAGYPCNTIKLAHVDNTFVYKGDGDYRGLLNYVDVTEKANPLLQQIPQWVAQMRELLAGEEPDIEMGAQCTTPYQCPFVNYCQPPQPDFPVTLLPHGSKVATELKAEGYEDLCNVPEGRLNNANHERVRRITVSGKPELLPGTAEILKALPYPRYYLDFETVAFAVPVWTGTRPYEALPFQWSCHIEHADGSLEHEEFLDTSGVAPMRALAEKMITTLGEEGIVFMYSSFERRIIRELAARFPDLSAELESIVDRLFDLLPLVRKHYYHPDMKGSWSIKAVLPTVAPDLNYEELDKIHDGMAASSAFMEIVSGNMSVEDKARTTQSLLEYRSEEHTSELQSH